VLLLLLLAAPNLAGSFVTLSTTIFSKANHPNWNVRSFPWLRSPHHTFRHDHVVSLTSWSLPSTASSAGVQKCDACGAEFVSRNALFRHLGASADCGDIDTLARPTKPCKHHMVSKPCKHHMVFQLGYYHQDHSMVVGFESSSDTRRTATVRQLLEQAFVQVTGHVPYEVTQMSGVQRRHPCLDQDPECHAMADVVSVKWNSPTRHLDGGTLITATGGRGTCSSWIEHMNSILSSSLKHPSEDFSFGSIEILNAEVLSISQKTPLFHAETSCTQRMYHYVLPLEWLIDGHDISSWWHRRRLDDIASSGPHQPRGRGQTQSSPPPPAVLVRLKQALKQVESQTVDITSNMHSTISETGGSVVRMGPGRFGSLAQKERRCWHNFCSSPLSSNNDDGSISSMRISRGPSQEHVWRAIDRARIVDFVMADNHDTNADETTGGKGNKDRDVVAVVLEFRGDGFVTQQVRHIMGSVVAMTNEWLPPTFFQVATQPNVCLPPQNGTTTVPLAPPGRLYLAGARYHFLDLVRNKQLFSSSIVTTTTTTNSSNTGMVDDPVFVWRSKLQSRILRDRARMKEAESMWWQELKDVTAPQIRSELETIATAAATKAKDQEEKHIKKVDVSPIETCGVHLESPPPPLFETTMSLLRKVVDTSLWPKTSLARSRNLRSPSTNGLTGNKRNPMTSSFPGDFGQSGSFTIVNKDVPSDNAVFPELVQAIFELERQLVNQQPRRMVNTTHHDNESLGHDDTSRRMLSTHCAVNRNVAFTPHLDSGEGNGLSMIVSLGDFAGGAFVVEGDDYDIRYKPLEFDGWKQPHWTQPFEGERFSLVWFTPKDRSDDIDIKHDNSNDDKVGERKEDRKANDLVRAHAAQVSSYPLLKFRPNSTDALVINEILDSEKGCAYELRSGWNNGIHEFSPQGHACVLDIGAHIGVFARFALGLGCPHVIVYEPEPSNIELLRQNVKPLDNVPPTVDVHMAAVAHGNVGMRNLVRARNRNDGTLNTWRHALEDYSQYTDKMTPLPSETQEAVLTRSPVQTVPFFGHALTPNVTFVKLDCEGAEIDILSSPECRNPNSWLNVTHLVFEWSFTKERQVDRFHYVVENLVAAGFQVWYPGQGAWWDTEQNVMWPYHNDLVVFATREVE